MNCAFCGDDISDKWFQVRKDEHGHPTDDNHFTKNGKHYRVGRFPRYCSDRCRHRAFRYAQRLPSTR
jgi:hypothetical protein